MTPRASHPSSVALISASMAHSCSQNWGEMWERRSCSPLCLGPSLHQYFGHLMQRANSLENTLMLGKTGQQEKGPTEDEMVRWHHRLKGHEFEQTPGDGEGQGSLACCIPWGHKQLDTMERLNKIKPLLHPLSSQHCELHGVGVGAGRQSGEDSCHQLCTQKVR